jgi:hypothetical protein
MRRSTLLFLIVVTFTACAARASSQPQPDQSIADSQIRLNAQSEQIQEMKQQNDDRESAHATSRKSFNDLVAHYDHPGPECARYLALSTEERVDRVNKIQASFNRIYGSVQTRNNNNIAASTVAYGGIVGLGTAMNAQDEEHNLYLSLGEQLDQLKDDPQRTHVEFIRSSGPCSPGRAPEC